MTEINAVVADNLRQIREDKKISLAEAARLIGVSKSLLSQIERGEVNPTISTVWKIASGLKVSFSSLCTRPEADLEVTSVADLDPVTSDGGRFRNFPLFGFDENRRFEVYYIELDSKAVLAAEPHLTGCQEFITVFAGRLELEVDGRTADLGPGMAVRFLADRPHHYVNPGDEVCRLSMIIYYP